MSPSRPSLPYAPRETRATDGEYQLGGCARVALVSLTLSAGFGLAGCAAIDDLKVSIFQWLDPVNFTGEGEELLGYAPETRLIPPAEIPKQAAKAPSKRIKPATRKLQRPQTVVLPPKKPPIAEFPESGNAGRDRGTVRAATFDATGDSLSRSASALRREVLRRVLGPARKS